MGKRKSKLPGKPKSFVQREAAAIRRYERVTAPDAMRKITPDKPCSKCGQMPKPVEYETAECVYCGDPTCERIDAHGDAVAVNADDVGRFPFERFDASRPVLVAPEPRAGYKQHWFRSDTAVLPGDWKVRLDYDDGTHPLYARDVVLCEHPRRGDGVALFSASHPLASWWRSLLTRFRRLNPKSVEPHWINDPSSFDSDDITVLARSHSEDLQARIAKWRRIATIAISVKAAILAALGVFGIHWWHILRALRW